MLFKSIIKLFEKGNVSVSGLRGSGKDMLMSNVVVRRKKPYVSNVDYGGMYMPLRFDLLNCGGNTYKDFINQQVKFYEYPYCDGTDIYISDCGIYFPSQHFEQLNREFKDFTTFQALTRHLGACNLHYNSQNLNRVWDKIREQSDIYIKCDKCYVIFKKYVIQKGKIYEKYESSVNNVQPFKMHSPLGLFAKRESKDNFETLYSLKKQDYANTHGKIKPFILIYKNKSTYDTRRFKQMLLDGIKEGEINESKIKKV